MIELRISHWEFSEFTKEWQDRANAMIREYGEQWGLDHEFMFYYVQLNAPEFVMANLRYPDVVEHLKQAR